jgi:hypothetical protein
MVSYAKGCQYHPIELSVRFVAAMMGFIGKRAKKNGQRVLDDLIECGLLEQMHSGSGKQSAMYRVSFNNKDTRQPERPLKDTCDRVENLASFNNKDTQADRASINLKATPSSFKESPEKERTATADQFDEHEVVDNTSIYVQSKKEEQKKKLQKKEEEVDFGNFEEKDKKRLPTESETIAEIQKLFDHSISKSKIKGMIMATNLENIQTQLEWFPYQDVSGFDKGPSAAFCYYCVNQVGEPEALKTKKRLEKERKEEEEKKILMKKQEEERKKKEAASQKRFDEIWSGMEQEERDEWLQKARDAMLPSMRYMEGLEDTVVFKGYLKAVVLQAYTH